MGVCPIFGINERKLLDIDFNFTVIIAALQIRCYNMLYRKPLPTHYFFHKIILLSSNLNAYSNITMLH